MTKIRLFGLVSLLACMPWLGGLVVLGAIVAPTVFHAVPAPTNADAMTLVFRRFDRLAVAASVVVLLCEVGLATVTRTARDAVRSAGCIGMSALAIYQGTTLSPRIEGLHMAGAIRGIGDLGIELDRTHHVAELLGKTQLALGIAYVLLLVWTLTTARVAEAPSVSPRDGGAKDGASSPAPGAGGAESLSQ